LPAGEFPVLLLEHIVRVHEDVLGSASWSKLHGRACIHHYVATMSVGEVLRQAWRAGEGLARC